MLKKKKKAEIKQNQTKTQEGPVSVAAINSSTSSLSPKPLMTISPRTREINVFYRYIYVVRKRRARPGRLRFNFWWRHCFSSWFLSRRKLGVDVEVSGEQDSSFHSREPQILFSNRQTSFYYCKGCYNQKCPRTEQHSQGTSNDNSRKSRNRKIWLLWSDGSDCWWLPALLPRSLRIGAVRNQVSSTWCGTGVHKELCSSWSRLACALHGTDEARWGEAWGQPFPRWGGPLLIQTHDIFVSPPHSVHKHRFSTAPKGMVWSGVLKAHRDHGHQQVGICLPF